MTTWLLLPDNLTLKSIVPPSSSTVTGATDSLGAPSLSRIVPVPSSRTTSSVFSTSFKVSLGSCTSSGDSLTVTSSVSGSVPARKVSVPLAAT